MGKITLPPPLETAVQDQIKGYLAIRGWFCSNIRERYFTGKTKGKFSEPGIPDMLCIKGGRVVMLEVKRPRSSYSKPNDNQKAWHAEWQRQGGEVYVVRSVEDAMEVCDKEAPNEAFF